MRMQIPPSTSHLSVTLQALPEGVRGIKDTLDQMVKWSRQGRKTLAVRRLALRIVSSELQKSWLAEAKAIQEYVRDHIRYVKDVTDTETLQTPEITIQFGQGDCDDKALLASALLESIGHPTRFVAVGSQPNVFSHVLVETRIGGRWVSVETTEAVPLGWQPSNMPYRLVRNVTNR